MLHLTWEFKLKPTAETATANERILGVCCQVWNFGLRERKDWLNSRKSPVNACSIVREYVLPADLRSPNYASQSKALTAAKRDYPELKTVNAQVLQQVLRKLEVAWEAWRLKRAGFPRFKKPHRMRSFWFPQMLKNCIPPRGTSQECPDCGAEVRKDLSVRVHQCPDCGSTKPRDIAAAQVISARGQRVVEKACGDGLAGAEVTQSSQVSLKQELFGAIRGITPHIA